MVWLNYQIQSVITARVRSTTGRYCFHRCLSVHRGGGGVRGVPDRVPPRGGYLTGYPPGGVPGPPGGVPRPPQGGYPDPPRGGFLTGYPPGGYPDPPGGVPDWVPPRGVPDQVLPPGGGTQLGQHSEYLLHSGRYASCVHAGGLSCFILFSSRYSW